MEAGTRGWNPNSRPPGGRGPQVPIPPNARKQRSEAAVQNSRRGQDARIKVGVTELSQCGGENLASDLEKSAFNGNEYRRGSAQKELNTKFVKNRNLYSEGKGKRMGGIPMESAGGRGKLLPHQGRNARRGER